MVREFSKLKTTVHCAKREFEVRRQWSFIVWRLGLYTLLQSPILHGVWHTKGRSGGGRILRDSRAIVLQ